MIRKAALYAWLALIGAGILYWSVQGKVQVAGYATLLPPSVPQLWLLVFGGAILALTLLNFYFFFHPTPRDQRERRSRRR